MNTPHPLPRPRIVTLVGSTRFADWDGRNYWDEASLAEILKGHAVFSLGVHRADQQVSAIKADEQAKTLVDFLHLQKIQASDDIFVLNVGGYVGESAAREIDFARWLGKRVRWLEPDAIPARFTAPLVGALSVTHDHDDISVCMPGHTPLRIGWQQLATGRSWMRAAERETVEEIIARYPVPTE